MYYKNLLCLRVRCYEFDLFFGFDLISVSRNFSILRKYWHNMITLSVCSKNCADAQVFHTNNLTIQLFRKNYFAYVYYFIFK